MEEYLQVGVISSPHGVRGEVKVYPTTDEPERFRRLKSVLVETKTGLSSRRILGVKLIGQMVVLKLEGIEDRNAAEGYRSAPLLIPRKDALPLKEGEYYLCDLIGLEVYQENGEFLGTLEEVLRTGANDVYLVRTKNEKEVLIPNIKDCIIEVALKKHTMTVHLLEGML